MLARPCNPLSLNFAIFVVFESHVIFFYPLLDTRISVCPPLRSRLYYPSWNLKPRLPRSLLDTGHWSLLDTQILFVFVFVPFQEYGYICLVNMWHPNIFGYLFIEICDIQIYLDIHSCPFYDICLPLLPPWWLTKYVKGS